MVFVLILLGIFGGYHKGEVIRGGEVIALQVAQVEKTQQVTGQVQQVTGQVQQVTGQVQQVTGQQTGEVKPAGEIKPDKGKKEEKKEEGGIFQRLIAAYKKGDWPMHFILLMLIVILALSIERFVALYGRFGKNPSKDFEEVNIAFKNGGIESAKKKAAELKTPIGGMLYTALQVTDKITPGMDEDEAKELIKSAVEEEYLRISPQVQRRVSLISIFANSAVLLGLLGAVIGLIEAFAGVGAIAEPAQRQIYLSNSIAIVMHSTAFGLIVAITGVILYSIISTKANSIMANLDEYSVRIINWVSLVERAEREKRKQK